MDWKLIKENNNFSSEQVEILKEIMSEGYLQINEAHIKYKKKSLSELIRKRFITFDHSLDKDFYELDNEGLALFFTY